MNHRGYKIELHESDFTRITSPSNLGVAIKDFSIDNFEKGLLLQTSGDIIIGDIAREGGGKLSGGEIKTFPDIIEYPI